MNIHEIIILKLYVVVNVARCCWVHAYSYKVGGSCPVNVNHSKHVDFESLCSDLGVDAPALILGVYAPALLKESLL